MREAQTELTRVDANSTGVKKHDFEAVSRIVKIKAVDPKIANIEKHEMLSRGGDIAGAESFAKF